MDDHGVDIQFDEKVLFVDSDGDGGGGGGGGDDAAMTMTKFADDETGGMRKIKMMLRS